MDFEVYLDILFYLNRCQDESVMRKESLVSSQKPLNFPFDLNTKKNARDTCASCDGT